MDDLLQQIITAILTAVGSIISGYVVVILHRFQQKVGMQNSAELDAKVRASVQNAILATDERARAEVLKRVAPVLNKVEIKMAETATRVLEAVPGITKEEATQLVNEELPKVRAVVTPAVGTFLGQVGAAVAPSPQPDPPPRPSSPLS